MRALRVVLLSVGAVCAVLAVPLLLFALFGALGVLADVGPTENRALGVEFLSYGLPLLLVGATLLAIGLRAT